ncbi:MAG: hypothetical protein JXR68_06370 [Bacteroidales bacterium]|nr:hypothetical protein [Bacteroidales bacterium]
MDKLLLNSNMWNEVLFDLKTRNPRQRRKIKEYANILSNNLHLEIAKSLINNTYIFSIPKKVEINKIETKKKKIIYLFNYQDDFLLKVINKILTQKYSHLISTNCHSFQANKGAKTAFRSILSDKSIKEKYVLKTDISNFFNSINPLDFINNLPNEILNNSLIKSVLDQVILSNKSLVNNTLIYENKGLMAGTAIAPFLSNLYLKFLDSYFLQKGVTYVRYSDDIILFDTRESIDTHFEHIQNELSKRGLQLNLTKTKIVEPNQKWEFLGFSYDNGIIDIAEVTVNKLKAKIKRLSRRYYRKFDAGKFSKHDTLSFFIKKLNNKFYGKVQEINTLCWSKWFFPLINTSETLNVVDKYIQDRLRYCVTGKYNKLNYKKVSYSLLKYLEYKPLKAAYYLFKYDYEKFNKLIQI